MRRFAVLAVLLLAASAGAQGTLGTQGFGYPPGQLSTRAMGQGGAFGEFDPRSPLNPASLVFEPRSYLYLQYDPEFRSLSFDGRTDHTSTARFPLIAAIGRFGPNIALGIASSTFLDRTWETRYRASQVLGADSVAYTESFRSDGAINDFRFAGSYLLSDKLSIGAAVHFYPGENRLTITRVFDDTTTFGPLGQSTTINYTGRGYSAGLIWHPIKGVGLSASGRLGQRISVRRGDTAATSADVPDRFGFAVQYARIAGAALYASAEHIQWSALQGLGSSGVQENDAWEYAAGGQLSGQRLGGRAIDLRFGGRQRTLPFSAIGHEVRELSFMAGAGAPFAHNRAELDLAIQHASRTASGLDAKERAWTLSLGLSVHP